MAAAPLLTLLFFFSGVSGLLFQVVWFRRLSLVFGVTSYALGLVLAAFMLGLAIGSMAAGTRADRSPTPLRDYAIAEAAIALLGFLVLPFIDVVQAWYVNLAHLAHDAPRAVHVFRFALTFVALLPVTFCMGATLPLGVRALDRSSAQFVARLYAANTAGAVFGVLAGAFLLLGVIGLSATAGLAACLNTACAVLAWRASRHAAVLEPRLATPAPLAHRRGPDDDRPEAPPSGHAVPHTERGAATPDRRAIVAALFVSGAGALAAEVVWTRLFSVLAFEVVYAYAVMLAVLLAGVALAVPRLTAAGGRGQARERTGCPMPRARKWHHRPRPRR